MSLEPAPRDCVIRVRVTEAERKVLREVARELQISVSDVVRLGASRFCNGDRANAKYFARRQLGSEQKSNASKAAADSPAQDLVRKARRNFPGLFVTGTEKKEGKRGK